MKDEAINLTSLRARKARLRRLFRHDIDQLLAACAFILLIAGLYLLFLSGIPAGQQLGYATLAVVTTLSVLLLWYYYDLKPLHTITSAATADELLEANLLGSLTAPLTPRSVWQAALNQPEAKFMANHLLLPYKLLAPDISDNNQDMAAIWQEARDLMQTLGAPELHAGILMAAILLTSESCRTYLTREKLMREDIIEVLHWLERQLEYIRQPRPRFGGIGRDWATGFTPTLEHFGQNMSRAVEAHGGFAHYFSHSDLLDGVISSLSRGAAVALVGSDGVGKSTLVYGLAQRLLEGRDPQLEYYQVVSLNASVILSYSGSQLEKLLLTLFGEAAAAGNIILFLDDAQLFFTSGVGSFDMSYTLLPVLKNRNIKLIAAFTPVDWQQLQTSQQALANSFTNITLNEPAPADTFKVIEDTALVLEQQNHALISYAAIREAYRLSGQYMQEQAYPGKAIHLLEQAIPYADQGLLAAESVQAGLEKTKGVRVSAAQAPEAEVLLNLEDRIHERMINQKRAVNVVAAALRRGRAGVSNPKRPVGSFLFLGPTGVGKTELARSLAAVYFGDEQQMIRLDMSEYQQSEDVSRLLASGGRQEQSLLLKIREQPFAVVLLDEIEKAHPNILNLLLQMLDEGQLTDEQGRPASFRSSIIIATSNAGAADIAAQMKTAGSLDNFERPLIDKLIAAGQFKPELINRFDEVVLFRPLTEDELALVARIMLADVNRTLATQQVSVQLSDDALQIIVRQGYDPEFGARPMRRIIQKSVENVIAIKILRGEVHPGDQVLLTAADLAAASN